MRQADCRERSPTERKWAFIGDLRNLASDPRSAEPRVESARCDNYSGTASQNGIIAAPFLILVMMIAHDRTIMGEHVNGRLARTLGWFTTALMALAALAYFAVTYL